MTESEIRDCDVEQLRLWVAQHVFGFLTPFEMHPVPCPDGLPGCEVLHRDWCAVTGARLADYSTSIADAWQVMEAMKAAGCSFGLWVVPSISSVQPGVLAAFVYGVRPPERRRLGMESEDGAAWSYADDGGAAEAICRAALLACLKKTAAGA